MVMEPEDISLPCTGAVSLALVLIPDPVELHDPVVE
jgi:hypothetical protein